MISATRKYTTSEFNTTEDTTTDYDYDYSTKTEYMTAKYNRTEDTATDHDYDYSITEKTMTKKDTAIENNEPKSRLIKTIEGNKKYTLRSQQASFMAIIIESILVPEY